MDDENTVPEVVVGGEESAPAVEEGAKVEAPVEAAPVEPEAVEPEQA